MASDTAPRRSRALARRLAVAVTVVSAVLAGGLYAPSATALGSRASSRSPDPDVAAVAVAGSYAALSPARVLDTRSKVGAVGPVAPHGTVHLQLLGKGGVPATGVSAVVVNVTVTTPTAGGSLTVYPDGATMPNASNLNFASRQTIANLVIAKVGTNGRIALTNNTDGSLQLIADVAGYYVSGTPATPGAYAPLAPARVMDTRYGVGATGPVAAHGTVHLQVLGRGGVPTTGVSAVALTLTVTRPRAAGSLVAYPDGTTRPTASNLNFVTGRTIPNLVVTKVGADGRVAVTNNSGGTVQLVADIAGYFLAGTPTGPGAYAALPPARVLDTRSNVGATNPVAAHGTAHLQVVGKGGIPASGASAVVVNVTVTQTRSAGDITVHPDGSALPRVSNVNFVAGQTIPNLVIAKVGADGKIALTNNSGGTVQLVADIAGYFVTAGSCRTVGHQAVVYLDPGHGANITPTPATSGGSKGIYSGENTSGGNEDANVFVVASRAKSLLEDAGYRVVLSRTSNPDSQRRTLWQKGNAAETAGSGGPADIGVSLHTDVKANIGAGQIYYDNQGGYRQNNANSTKRVFDAPAVAARSKTFATAFQKARTRLQGAPISIFAGHTFPASRSLGSHGTIPIVMLSAQDVPWVYNEYGRTTSSGLSAQDLTTYVTSVVQGVEASVGAAAGTGDPVLVCS